MAKIIVIILQGTRILEIKLEPVMYVQNTVPVITTCFIIKKVRNFNQKQWCWISDSSPMWLKGIYTPGIVFSDSKLRCKLLLQKLIAFIHSVPRCQIDKDRFIICPSVTLQEREVINFLSQQLNVFDHVKYATIC